MAGNVGKHAGWLLAIGVLVWLRLAFYLTTPMLDNDSIVIIMGAREWIQNGNLSKVNTLAVLLTGLLYMLFGEHILVARLPQLLGGIGCMVLLLGIGKRVGKTAGPMAAVLFGSLPIAILYSSIAKTYSLMVFLILCGAWMYDRAVRLGGLHRGILAAFSWSGAFLCYTFAASAVFPVAILLILAILSPKYRNHLQAALVSGLVFGFCVAAVIAWRWQEFGWSVFNDYATDWRFELSTAIWHGRWVGLTDIWALGIALLVPGLVLLIRKPDVLKPLGPLGIYGILFCLINVLVWLTNPVNHFPRVLLPSLPFVSLFLGVVINRLVEEKIHLGTAVAWFLSAILALGILYPRLRHGDRPLTPFVPDAPKGILLTLLAIAAGFLALTWLFFFLRKTRQKRAWLIPLLLSLTAILTGPWLAWDSIAAQAKIFQARVELVDRAGVRNILDGGDYQALAALGPDSVSRLLDFSPEELNQVLDGGLLELCKSRGISHVIVSHSDPEGTLEMLAGLATKQGRDIRDIGRIYNPLFDSHQAARIADNDYGALFLLRNVEPKPWTPDQKKRILRYHSKYEIVPASGMLWFSNPVFETPMTNEKPVREIVAYYEPDGATRNARMAASILVDDARREVLNVPVEPAKGAGETIPVEGFAGRQLLVEIRLEDGSIFRQISMLIDGEQP